MPPNYLEARMDAGDAAVSYAPNVRLGAESVMQPFALPSPPASPTNSLQSSGFIWKSNPTEPSTGVGSTAFLAKRTAKPLGAIRSCPFVRQERQWRPAAIGRAAILHSISA